MGMRLLLSRTSPGAMGGVMGGAEGKGFLARASFRGSTGDRGGQGGSLMRLEEEDELEEEGESDSTSSSSEGGGDLGGGDLELREEERPGGGERADLEDPGGGR